MSHDSIQLQWSMPQYGEFNVEVYTISYHEIKDPPELEPHWKKVQKEGTKPSAIVGGLTPQTAYSFKVHAAFKPTNGTVSLVSDISDPIQTYPVPVPPGKPTTSNVTHNSVQLEWSEPLYGGHHIEFYNISYYELKDPPELKEWKQIQTTNSNALSIVSNLAAQTAYSFKVRAEFNAGVNLVSETSEPVKTKPPPVPPGKPIVSCVTHNSLHLEWSKPQYNEENVELYTMFCHEIKDSLDPEQTWKEVETESPIYEKSVTVSSLASQTEYAFKVHAKFTSGMVLVSETSDPIQTYPVPVPPGKPIASNVTHNSIHLEWSEPQYGEQSVEFYTVLYCEIKDPPINQEQWKNLRLDSAQQSLIVGHLASSTVHSFKVRAQFKAGIVYSEVSDPVQTHPHPIPPGKPFASAVTFNSINLEWSKAQFAGQNIESYTVFYHEIKAPKDLEPQWKQLKIQGVKESAKLSDLAAQTQYSVKVQAKSKTGSSLVSDVSDPVQTYPIPVPPGKPIASNVTHNSVQLKWSQPQYGRQSTEFYTVLYCEMKDPLKQWKELRLDSTMLSITITNLASQTVYSFKVHAQFKAGVICSAISDHIQTHSPPVPPGKPFASAVTYNTIQLGWTKAQYGGQDTELYSVLYQEIKDPPGQWKEIKSNKEVVTVSHLTAKTDYSFKVCAEFKTGMQIVSEISDPIQTYPFPVLPGKPTASNVTHNSIQLEWTEAHYRTENCTLYTVSYCDSLFGQWKEIKAPKSSVTVGDLIAQTEYSFKIDAEFRSGMHLASETSDLIRTYPVPVPPGKPIASNVTRDGLRLEWSMSKYGGENAEFYTVLFYKLNDPTKEWKELKTDHPLCRESLPIEGMHPTIQYYFRVHAHFKAGNTLVSEVSDPLQTILSVPPGKPTASKVTHNSVHLEWSEANYGEHKPVQSYTVFYHAIKAADPPPLKQWRKVITPNTSVIVSHLKAQTGYYFKVHAEFKTYNTLASSLSDPIQTMSVPVRPGKPVASDITHGSVLLKWSKAHYGQQNVEYYTVISSEIKDSSAHDQKETKTQNTSVTIMELTAEAKYSFKVHAEFKAGITLDSDPSDPIQMKPFPVHPGRPTFSNITHNSVTLEWSKAHYGEYKVEWYTVFPFELKSQNQGEETRALNTSVIVNGLTPETKYSFKVYADVKAASRHGITLASDFSDPIQTSPLPVNPGKPIISNITYNSVKLEWSDAHYGEHKVESYTVFSCKIKEPSTQESWKEIKTLNTSITVSDLTAETKYSFRVQANFKPCIILDSEFSDTIQTNPCPQPPGKPTACSMTHDSIQVQFSRAQYGAQKVELYNIFYRRIKDSRHMEPWREVTSTSTDVTVGGLVPQSVYSFKVDAKLQDGTILSGDISDPIQTHLPPLPPGKPFASSRTHNSVLLEWSKPQYERRIFHCYTVFYRRFKGPWKEVKLDNPISKESVLIMNLTPKTEHSFKVHALFNNGVLNSEISDPICTHPAVVIPGKPYPFSVTHNSIQLQWPRPAYGAEHIAFYTVLYREMNSKGPNFGHWKERKSRGAIESITISGLGAKKKYSIKIRAEIKPCDLSTSTSEVSDPITTKDRIALQMLSKKPTIEGPLEFHNLLMVEQMTDKTNRIKKCFVGKQPRRLSSENRVLLVVGATGAGKSTLINGMINYILGVEWKDNFRFKLITEEGQHTQAKSQTKWITAYTLPKMEGSPVPYTLTIIDTPGFGDTEGLERDRVITKQIKEFFSMGPPHGIDHVDGIGFVTQSALARLTPTQQYIFNAILAIFGKDVADNIFMMVTFADGQSPPVMAAIKAAEIPCCKFYKFNNSALFASNDVDEADEGDPEADNFDRMFWKMGFLSFKQFFTDFYKAKPASLVLTREVLEERERLETTISGLHPQIRRGLAKIEEMRQEEEVLRMHEAEITTNKEFNYVIELTKQRKIDLKGKGIHVTNCLQCNYTCHNECRIPKDEDKHRCSAMDRSGFCTVCTKKCKWDRHVNNPYRFEEIVVEETRTSEDLKKRYDQAVDGKTQKESMMIGIDNQLKAVHTEVLTMIKRVQRCLHRLDEIALRPNPLAEVDFLDLLIESEKQQAQPGWLHRVRYYESAKEQAVLLKHLQAKEVVADLDTEKESETPNRSWYDRFKYWFGLSS